MVQVRLTGALGMNEQKMLVISFGKASASALMHMRENARFDWMKVLPSSQGKKVKASKSHSCLHKWFEALLQCQKGSTTTHKRVWGEEKAIAVRN